MDPGMAAWEAWVRSTALSAFVIRHGGLWPALETLHYIGLSLLLGTVGLFDLRVLGMARSIAPAALHKLLPWGIGGYALNLLTGFTFFSGYPEQYAYNSAFHFKLAFMTLAGLNVALFYSTAFREVRALPAGATAPLRARVITGISLLSWIAVLVCGRLLTFYRPPFFH
jgi:hypothetical protein